jgi:hypothetical protein
MRWLGSIRDGMPEARGRVSGWWHGEMPVSGHTWTERNIGSTTENSTGDITLTFRLVYQATPCVAFGGGAGATGGTADQVYVNAISASSVRFVTKNTSGTALKASKTSAVIVGDY